MYKNHRLGCCKYSTILHLLAKIEKMRMKRLQNSGLLLVVFFVLSCGNLMAQQGSVSGRVLDERTKAPLPFATVQAKGTGFGAVTDFSGRYSFQLPAGEQSLVCTYIGYRTMERKVIVKAGVESVADFSIGTEDTSGWKPVVVTAGRLEQRIDKTITSMEVLPARLVEARVDNNMETAIEQVPGVTVIDGQANIRGGSGFSYGAGSRVLVMVDDLPMMAGDANDVKWSFIPIEQMEQVEVLKGASSALYGSSALNGVINMRTVMPGDKPSTTVTTFAGIYDTPKSEYMRWWDEERFITGTTISHRQKIKNLSVVAGGQYFYDDGYRLGETEVRYRANTHLRYTPEKLKGLTVGLAVNAQRAEGGAFLVWEDDSSGALIPQGALVPGEQNTLSKYQSDRLTVDPYVIYSKGAWVHKLRTRYFYSNNTNDTEQGSKSKFYYADYLAQRRAGLFTLSVGVNLTRTKASGDLYDTRDGSSTAFYAQIDGDLGRLVVTAGLRAESATTEELPANTDKSFSGVIHYELEKFEPRPLMRGGFNYELFKYTHLRFSAGQGYRFPSIAERFVRTRVGDIVIYPNQNLEPETGWSVEWGLKQGLKVNSWKGFADVAYFITGYTDMMEFTFGTWGNPQTDPLFGLGFKSINIGNTRISGFEFTLAGEGKIGQVQQSILAGYTYIDPVQTDFNPARDTILNSSKENILKYRFQHLVKFDTETTWKKFFIGISGRYYSRIENIDKAFEFAINGVKSYREQQPAGNWIFDLRAGANLTQQLRLSAIVKNILNEEFMSRPADIQAPRTFTISISLKV